MIHNALSPGLRAALSAHNTPLGVPPVFLADFAGTGSLIPSKGSGLSITRTGGATRVGPTGLVEFAPENLHGHTDFTSAHWAKIRASVVAAGEGMPGVYAAYPASKLIASSDPSNSHRVDDDVVLPSPNTAYTFSVVAKASEYNGVALSCNWASPVNNSAVFDLRDGSTDIIGGEAVASGSEDLGGGWYRCWATFNVGVLVQDLVHVSVADPDAGPAILDKVHFTGNDSDGILIGCPMISRGSTLHDFVATSGSPYYSPRIDYDPATLECRGLLLEGAATQRLGYSTDIGNASGWSVTNVTTSSSVAFRGWNWPVWREVAVANVHRVYQDFIGGMTAVHAVSFFYLPQGRPKLNLHDTGYTGAQIVIDTDALTLTGFAVSGTVTPVEDGWFHIQFTRSYGGINNWRFALGFADDTGASIYAGDVTKGGVFAFPQIVAGSTFSSFIPNYGAQDSTTRTADQWDASAPISPTGNSGTLCFEGFVNPNAPSTTFNAGILQLRLDDDNEVAIYCRTAYSDKLTAIVRSGGTPETPTPPTGPVPDPAIKVKVAFAWGPDGNSLYVDGVEYDSPGPTYNPSGLTSLVFGNSSATSQNGNRAVSKVTLYNKRLPDSKLQTLTT